MTTTELIDLLKSNERGGVTGRSRHLNFYINDDWYIPNPNITIVSSGDGMLTTLELNLQTKELPEITDKGTGHWIVVREAGLDCVRCSECGKHTQVSHAFAVSYAYEFKYCPYCGVAMVGNMKVSLNYEC